jgi:AraC-like DNA-binding protein/ligand-binding sensor protein
MFMAHVATQGFYDIPETAVRAFETLTGLRIAIHGNTWVPFLTRRRVDHGNPYCRLIKNRGYEPACERMDLGRVGDFLEHHPEGFVKACHAGILEWVAPVMHSGDRSAVLFAGVRQQSKGVAVDLSDERQSRACDIRPKDLPELETVTAEQSRLYMESLRQLTARLELWMANREKYMGQDYTATANSTARQRHAAIERFIAERYQDPIQLDDLARQIHLSRSRTAHLVKEVCGSTFGQQLQRWRLRHALGLIWGSDCSISEAAMTAGFGDLSNFHKAFRKTYGTTPLQMRRQR